MYNKSIQLHTSAKQNVTSGYRTVRGLYKGNTGDVSECTHVRHFMRGKHIYKTFTSNLSRKQNVRLFSGDENEQNVMLKMKKDALLSITKQKHT